MKNIRFTLVAALLLFLAGQKAEAVEIQHLDPPCWWVGMKNTELQILVHGQGISNSSVDIKYPGVTVKEIVRTENPNYLFIYLDIFIDAHMTFAVHITRCILIHVLR